MKTLNTIVKRTLDNKILILLSFAIAILGTFLMFAQYLYIASAFLGLAFSIILYTSITKKETKLYKLTKFLYLFFIFNLVGAIFTAVFVERGLIEKFTCYSAATGPYNDLTRIPCGPITDLALRYIRVIYSYTPFPIYSDEDVARFWFLVLLLIEVVAFATYGFFNQRKIVSYYKCLIK